jgi:hypothetical protein
VIFVSYARRDRPFVDQLVTALEQHGVQAWVDRLSIPGGTHWEAEISKALESCSAVVVVLSPAVGESIHVASELSLAQDYKRPIIPIIQSPWRPSEPSEQAHRLKFLLSGRQFVDFSTFGFDKGIELLLKAISAAPVQPREPRGRRRPSWRSIVVGSVGSLLVAVAAVLVARGLLRPPSVEGTWYADVAYSWGVTASEQFEFRVDGERLLGTASFGGARFPRRIHEGKIAGDRLFFVIKLQVRHGQNEREVIYEYAGQVKGPTIEFTLDNEGEPKTRLVAARTPDEARRRVPRLATGGTDPRLSFLATGAYGTDTIKAAVGKRQEAIRSCYLATEFDPVEHSSVHYLVKIGPDGRVTEVGPPGTDPRSAELDRCMARVLRSVDWGPPPDGRGTEIHLAFTALPAWRSR